MRSSISRSSTPARTTTGSRRHTPAATTDISKIARGAPNKSGSTQRRNTPPSGAASSAGTGVFQSNINKTAQPALLGDFAAASYVSAVDGTLSQDTKTSKPITTLVPEQPGIYQEKMQEAEDAFKSGEFRLAISLYNMSADFSNNSPEPLLGLMFSYFAASDEGYGLTCLYLKKTLECFPELPLVNIDMQRFYLDPVQYRRDLGQLEKYANKNPKDSVAQFVLGYFLWREDEPKKSRKALATALKYSNDKTLNEAIDTLWCGMVASGKVSGTLQSKKPDKSDKPKAPKDKTGEQSKKTSPASTGNKSQ